MTRGEIPFDKVKELTRCPYLVFDYPVPTVLQSSPEDMGLDYTLEGLTQQARMPIFIVHSASFPAFLERFATFVRDGERYLEIKFDPGADLK